MVSTTAVFLRLCASWGNPNLKTPALRQQVQQALFQLGFRWCAGEDDSQDIEEDNEMFYISSNKRDGEFIFYDNEDRLQKESLKDYNYALTGRKFLSQHTNQSP